MKLGIWSKISDMTNAVKTWMLQLELWRGNIKAMGQQCNQKAEKENGYHVEWVSNVKMKQKQQILFWEALLSCCEEDARGSYSVQWGFGGYLGPVPVQWSNYVLGMTWTNWRESGRDQQGWKRLFCPSFSIQHPVKPSPVKINIAFKRKKCSSLVTPPPFQKKKIPNWTKTKKPSNKHCFPKFMTNMLLFCLFCPSHVRVHSV